MNAEDELLLTPSDPDRAWRFDLVLPMLVRPRATLARIVANQHPTWRTPLVLLMLAAIGSALAAGSIKAAAAAAGEITFPPGFEFYTPEQQAQFQQAATATNNSTFNYLLPALGAVAGVIVVWFLVGWLLHLLQTLFGGRGTSRAALNIAAWSSLPLIAHHIVQTAVMLTSDQLIAGPGLSGFAPAGEGITSALLGGILSSIDIYLVWQIVLLYIGVRVSSQLPRAKCWLAVLLTMIIVLALRALPAAILAQFGGLTVIRPFL
jgi:hypothetical protein